jgi:alpha-tubulin suppressor-like RCC1 family protein
MTSNMGDSVSDLGINLPWVDLGPGRTVQQIALAQSYTCALLDNSLVKCWGSGLYLGQGISLVNKGDKVNTMGTNLPYTVLSQSTSGFCEQLAVGTSHVCALLKDKLVKCFGSNSNGQLGQERSAYAPNNIMGDVATEIGDYLPYVALGTNRTATQVAAGGLHSCAILDTGNVKCWGLNNNGQLGLGDTTQRGGDSITNGRMGDLLPIVNLGAGRTAKQLALGDSFSCALLDNNRVKCWGANDYGQLGLERSNVYPNNAIGDIASEMGDALPYVNLGTTSGSPRPVKQITAGLYFACAILADTNDVKCWGRNDAGQLGLERPTSDIVGDAAGEMGDVLPMVSLGTGRTARQIVAGSSFACALLDVGNVKCWGVNGYGQLLLGDSVSRGSVAGTMGDNLPAAFLHYEVAPAAGAVVKPLKFSTFSHGCHGNSHTCVIAALGPDGSGALKCWGANAQGQLGLGDTVTRGSNAATMGDMLPFVNVGSGRTARQVATGPSYTCAVLDNMQLRCWPGPVGIVDLGSGRTAKHVSTAGSSGGVTCVVLDNGKVKCWGYASYGQLGLGDTTARNAVGDALPYVPLGTGLLAKEVYVGSAHNCALFENQRVKCWGDYTYGQLGLDVWPTGYYVGDQPNEMGDSLDFVNLGTSRLVKQLAVGHTHNCAILDNDLLKCWGNNYASQLGLGHALTTGYPGQMGDSLPYINLGTGRTVKQVALGQGHTCAILDNDLLKCWGSNSNGQLGIDGDPAVVVGKLSAQMGDALPYVNFGTERTVKQVTTGSYFTCALLDNDVIKCWGLNYNAQLGLGVSNLPSYTSRPNTTLNVELGSFDCFECPSNKVTLTPCTVNVSATCGSSCSCGSFWNGTSCQACAAGTFSTGGASTSCTPCPKGTYMNATSTPCQCFACPTNTSTAGEGSTSSQQCLPKVSR